MATVNPLCYTLISYCYAGKAAKRSKVPYMNHINEGIAILEAIGASQEAIDAYTIHPLVQEDQYIRQYMPYFRHIPYRVMMFAMEYRHAANRGLLCHQVDIPSEIYTGDPLDEVREMLIADKVQNRKDFEIYHDGEHEKSAELDHYFRNWLRKLNVFESKYKTLAKVALHAEPPTLPPSRLRSHVERLLALDCKWQPGKKEWVYGITGHHLQQREMVPQSIFAEYCHMFADDIEQCKLNDRPLNWIY